MSVAQGLHVLIDLLLAPFFGLPDLLGLVLVSTVLGVLFLVIYGRISNQMRLKSIKRAIYASLLESILFRHDLRVSLRAQGGMFFHGLRYFAAAIPPIMVLIVPCLLFLGAMNLRWGVRGLETGEQTIVSFYVSPQLIADSLSVGATDERLEVSSPVREVGSGTVHVRIRSKTSEQGVAIMSLNLAEKVVIEHSVLLGSGPAATPRDTSNSLLDGLLFSHAPASSEVRAIRVAYPARAYTIFGYEIHWVVFFAIISILSGLATSKALRVEI